MPLEHMAGNKIEGQSDQFVLGVTPYMLICASLPYQGDKMTRQMFEIANEPPVDVPTINPALPECVVATVSRSLAKSMMYSYRPGDEMARAIRDCARARGAVDLAL